VEPTTGDHVGLGDFCVRPQDTVATALETLRRNRRGVAVVLDDADQVIGTVVDGDIRRAVLKGRSVEDPVAGVMSARPVLAEPAAGEEQILDLMLTHRIPCVPVVEQGRLVAVRALDEWPAAAPPQPAAMIMAGGRGARLRPVTDKVPKPLLKVGSTSIVERIILSLVAAGVRDVYLAVNYMAELFEERLGDGARLGAQLHYIREEQPLGTAGALGLLPPGDRGPVLVMNGDLVTTVDFARLFDFHWRHAGAVTVAGVEHLSRIPYGVLRSAEHHLLSIEEKPVRRDLCSAGIYVVDPTVLRLLPPGVALDMPDLIAGVVADGWPVHVFPILEKWYDIGGTAEFERVLVQFATGEEE
jgi:dTDP-glucose pyrophosphorylase